MSQVLRITIVMSIFFAGLLEFAESQTNKDEITKLLMQNGCAEKQINFLPIHLNSKDQSSQDFLAFCQDSCGANQCAYSIYVERSKKITYAGDFFGNFKVLKKVNKNYFDIEVLGQHPLTGPSTVTLHFNGEIYK